MNNDSTMVTPKRLKIETPIGSLESDSGSHTIDFLSIVAIIAIIFIGKKFMDKCSK